MNVKQTISSVYSNSEIRSIEHALRGCPARMQGYKLVLGFWKTSYPYYSSTILIHDCIYLPIDLSENHFVLS